MDADRDRIAVLIQQCEHLASEIFVWRRRHAHQVEERLATAEQVRQLSIRLRVARETIANMERSWFWRLRAVYVRIRNLIS